MIRLKLRFFGFVQGVGFRYTMVRLANPRHITGWVKNENDGSVSAEVQGNPKDIDLLIDDISHQRFIRISRIERREIPVIEGEKQFREDFYGY